MENIDMARHACKKFLLRRYEGATILSENIEETGFDFVILGEDALRFVSMSTCTSDEGFPEVVKPTREQEMNAIKFLAQVDEETYSPDCGSIHFDNISLCVISGSKGMIRYATNISDKEVEEVEK